MQTATPNAVCWAKHINTMDHSKFGETPLLVSLVLILPGLQIRVTGKGLGMQTLEPLGECQSHAQHV